MRITLRPRTAKQYSMMRSSPPPNHPHRYMTVCIVVLGVLEISALQETQPSQRLLVEEYMHELDSP